MLVFKLHIGFFLHIGMNAKNGLLHITDFGVKLHLVVVQDVSIPYFFMLWYRVVFGVNARTLINSHLFGIPKNGRKFYYP